MHRAVRIRANQQMPNYRKPSSFLIKESFPLPPYSSVIGMVHAVCGWKDYHPMQVSVQGSYASTVSDYATNYVFGIAYEKPQPGKQSRHQIKVDIGDGRFDGVTIGPKNYELLTDVRLILHIMPEDETLIQDVFSALDTPPVYPSLGRYEDLLQIEEVSIVELKPAEEGKVAANDIFMPVAYIDEYTGSNLVGTIYRINKVFELHNAGRGKIMRHWAETVMVRHVCKDAYVISPQMYIDSDNEMVFPA